MSLSPPLDALPSSPDGSTAPLVLRRHLLRPDGSAMLPDDGSPVGARGLSVGLCVAMSGSLSFMANMALGLGAGPVEAVDALAATAAGCLLAGVLTLPPLVVVNALARREGGLSESLAAAMVGPSVGGAWLLAGAPLLALYASTGGEGPAMVLMLAGLFLVALVSGLRAAVHRVRAAGSRAPAALPVAIHFLLTVWTALVLALHFG